MNENIVPYEDLKEVLRLPKDVKVTKVKNLLDKNNIEYFHGSNGVWTTYDLINASKGLGKPEPNDDQIEVL